MIFGKAQQTVVIIVKPNKKLNMEYLHLISKRELIRLKIFEFNDIKFNYIATLLI